MCIHSINLLHIIDIYIYIFNTQKLIDDRLKVRPSLIQDAFRGRPLGRLVCTWSRVTRFLHELFYPAKIAFKVTKKWWKEKMVLEWEEKLYRVSLLTCLLLTNGSAYQMFQEIFSLIPKPGEETTPCANFRNMSCPPGFSLEVFI